MKPASFFTVFIAAALLAGCATPASERAAPSSSAAKSGIVFASSPGAAEEADIAAVLQAKSGTQGTARIVQTYRAASGRDCAVINVNASQNWIACDNGGQWRVFSSTLTPDAVFGISPR